MDQIQSLVPNHNSQEIDEPKCKELTSRVMAHYGEFSETKSRIVCDNVFLLFSPTWLSSLELSFLWVARFKPSIVFRLVTDSKRPDQGASTENASDCGGDKGERKGIGGATHDGGWGQGRRTGSGEAEICDGGIGGKCRYAEKQDGGEGYGDFELCSGGQVLGCCGSASAQNLSVGHSERC